MGVHHLPPRFVEREEPLFVDLVGCGGSGSQMLSGLARLNCALRAMGHSGLHVNAFDPDRVTEANVGRQLFLQPDVGINKAVALVHRVNVAFGLAWEAHQVAWHGTRGVDLVVSCVDTRAARIEIDAVGRNQDTHYWLDLGNRESDGQVVLGEWRHETWIRKGRSVGQSTIDLPARCFDRLPTVLELFPEIRTSKDADDTAPSCSLAEALERQELFVNQTVVTWGLVLLWNLLRTGQIEWHGAFVNLKSGRTNPLPVDPEAWARMGFHPKRRSK